MTKTKMLHLVIIGFLISSCATKEKLALESDNILREKIIGEWVLEIPLSYHLSIFTITTFGKGGKYKARIWKTKAQKALIVTALGKWWIKDGKLYNTVHLVEPPVMEKAEEPIIDIIVEITENAFIFINDEGIENKYYRNK